MNRKVAKLIRGFCKVTNTGFRAMKRSYESMAPNDRANARKALEKFWKENAKGGFLDHKKYYDLKKPLAVPVVEPGKPDWEEARKPKGSRAFLFLVSIY
jgi:hypothetical protein